MRSKFRKIIQAAGFGTLAICAPANAFDFTLEVTADKAFTTELRNASRSYGAKAEKITNPQDILAAAQSDYRQMLGTLYRNAYYGGTVHVYVDGREASTIPPLVVPPKIDKVRIVVDPGPRFTFGKLSVAPLAPGSTLAKGFAPGLFANSNKIGDAADTAIEGWRAESYAKARVADQKVVADHRASTLDVAIAISTGPMVNFGKLIVEGNQDVRTKRIVEIAGLREGRRFRPDALEAANKRLARSGAFRSVVLTEAETLGPGNSMDITATLVEEKPRRFGFGAEVSSLDGATLSAFWLHRNLLGGAERLRLDGEISGIGGTSGEDYTLKARLTRPATFWTDTSLYVQGEVALLDEPDFYSKQIQLETGLTIQISDDFVGSAGFGLRYSNVRDDLGSRRFTHLIFPVSATLDRRDSTLNPAKGYYIDADILPFVGIRGSETGARIFADGRAYRGFGEENRFVLAGRLQAGSVVGASLAGTPPDLLFHSGGGGTVRGQPYQSLGVDLGGGNSVGGRSFLGASIEARSVVKGKFSVVAFADAGWIGAGSVPGVDAAMHSGAGLGLRYDTGIGPIRFDVAKPISGTTSEGIQLYVGIGQSF